MRAERMRSASTREPDPDNAGGGNDVNNSVVVVTGAAPLHPDAVGELPKTSNVIAADGALDHALAAGLSPSLLVGDLDSVSSAGLAWAEQHSAINRHSPDKDETDTELAIGIAVELNPAQLVLISGGGDRLDHTIAAIGALGHKSLTSIPTISGWWGDQRFLVLHGPGRRHLTVPIGTTISVLALHGPTTGITLKGVQWPLDNAELQSIVGRGISNVATSDSIEITIMTGVLTVFISNTFRSSSNDQPPQDPASRVSDRDHRRRHLLQWWRWFARTDHSHPGGI